jgi:hypothetical protein
MRTRVPWSAGLASWSFFPCGPTGRRSPHSSCAVAPAPLGAAARPGASAPRPALRARAAGPRPRLESARLREPLWPSGASRPGACDTSGLVAHGRRQADEGPQRPRAARLPTGCGPCRPMAHRDTACPCVLRRAPARPCAGSSHRGFRPAGGGPHRTARPLRPHRHAASTRSGWRPPRAHRPLVTASAAAGVSVTPGAYP